MYAKIHDCIINTVEMIKAEFGKLSLPIITLYRTKVNISSKCTFFRSRNIFELIMWAVSADLLQEEGSVKMCQTCFPFYFFMSTSITNVHFFI